MLQEPETIRTRPRPDCYVCGTPGEPLYEGLRDHLFNAPGTWNIKRCLDLDCGLLWLDPMPIEEDIGKAYTSYFTHVSPSAQHGSVMRRSLERTRTAYLVRKFGCQPRSMTWLDALLAHLPYLSPAHRARWNCRAFYLPAIPNGRLLEIGCGNGATLSRLQALGWRVEGLDFDPIAVSVARDAGLSVRCGRLEDQGYPDDTFDAVVMNHVLEHVPRPRELLMQCARKLKPGGRIVSITPNAASWGHRLFGPHWLGLDPPRHIHIFTLAALRRLSAVAKWSDCQVFGIVSDAHWILRESRRLRAAASSHGTPRADLFSPIWARSMQAIEWGLFLVQRKVAEEIVLSATKR